MSFSIKFYARVKWMDNRLKYENLKNELYRNEIKEEVAQELWKPALIFENHNERENDRQLLKYSPRPSILMLERKGLGADAPLSKAYEAKLYSSNETYIIWRSRNLVKLKCFFDLYYFPFDLQTCRVKVMR